MLDGVRIEACEHKNEALKFLCLKLIFHFPLNSFKLSSLWAIISYIKSPGQSYDMLFN